MLSLIRSSVSNIFQNVVKVPQSLNLSRNLSLLTLNKNLLNQTNNGSKFLLSKEIISSTQKPSVTPEFTQVRFNWGYKGRMMLKDIKRRELLRKFAPERIRLQSLRANTILPKVLRVYLINSLIKYSETNKI